MNGEWAVGRGEGGVTRVGMFVVVVEALKRREGTGGGEGKGSRVLKLQSEAR